MPSASSRSARVLRAACLALLAASSIAPLTAQGRKLHVYVLAGQSNMQGHAKVETFGYLADDPKTVPLLAKMQDERGAPRVCEHVWISSLSGGRGGDEAVGGKLTAGFGARRDPQRSDDNIGPELTFGIRIAEAVDGPVLLIKTAWGGKSLHTDFRPPSAGPSTFSADQLAQMTQRGADVAAAKAERQAATGRYYRAMIEHVRKVLADPAAACLDYDAKAGYELAGFVWFQGWNDMVDRGEYPQREQPGGYDAYTTCLAHLIHDVRKDLDAPGLPFVIGVMGVGGPIDGEPQGVRRVHANFRAAMAAPAAMPEFRGNVIAIETAPFWPMELQAIADKRGQVDDFAKKLRRDNERAPEAERLTKAALDAKIDAFRKATVSDAEEATYRRGASNAAFHYLGCAKTMAQIGEAFATALIR